MENGNFSRDDMTDETSSRLSDQEISEQILSHPEVQARLDEYIASRLRGDPIVLDDPNWAEKRMEELKKQIGDRDRTMD